MPLRGALRKRSWIDEAKKSYRKWHKNTFKPNYCPDCQRYVTPKTYVLEAIAVGLIIGFFFFGIAGAIGLAFLFLIIIGIMPGGNCPICGCQKLIHKHRPEDKKKKSWFDWG